MVTRVFISHSSKDTKLISLIQTVFKKREVSPFFARKVMTGKEPVKKIVDAIKNSLCLFALITSNSMHDRDTRDWIVFEIAVAHVKGKRIFCWIDKSIDESDMFPNFIKNITDYDTFEYHDNESCNKMVSSIVDKALEVKEEEEW